MDYDLMNLQMEEMLYSASSPEMIQDLVDRIADPRTKRLPPPDFLISILNSLSRVHEEEHEENPYPIHLHGLAEKIRLDVQRNGNYPVVKVLLKCWEVDPEGSIEEDDLPLIKFMLETLDNEYMAVGLKMLALYSSLFNIPAELYHFLFGIVSFLVIDDQRPIITLSCNISKDPTGTETVLGHRPELEMILNHLTQMDEDYIKLAIILGFPLKESRLFNLLDRDFERYFSDVVEYYRQTKPDELHALISNWIDTFVNEPEKINYLDVGIIREIMKSNLELQRKAINVLVCVPMFPEERDEWVSVLNPDIFDSHCKRLISSLKRILRPEAFKHLAFEIDTGENQLGIEQRIIRADKELVVLLDREKSIFAQEIEQRLRLSVKNKEQAEIQLVVPEYFSYGHLLDIVTNENDDKTPLHIEVGGVTCANEARLEIKTNESIQVKEGDAADNSILVRPIGAKLELLVREHEPSVLKRFDCRLYRQLLQKRLLYDSLYSEYIGKWNYLILNYQHLFSLKTRIFWLKSILSPERYIGRNLARKRFVIKRDTLFEQGMQIFSSDLASFWVIFDFEFEEEPGMGLGPTLEFYSEYSHELIKRLLNEKTEASGWKDLGLVIARCVLDQRYINLLPILYLFEEEIDGTDDIENEEFKIESRIRRDRIQSGIKEFYRSNPFPFSLQEIPLLIGNIIGGHGEKGISWRPDHGFTEDSMQLLWLIEVFKGFDVNLRSSFLQFLTGIPILGPDTTTITVVPKDGNDETLPSVMTCSNYLKLPRYSSKDVLSTKLLYAMKEGAKSFYLS